MKVGDNMKTVSDGLATHLNTEKNFTSCDLFELELASGNTYYYANTDCDITYGNHVYHHDALLIRRQQIRLQGQVTVDTLGVTIYTDGSYQCVMKMGSYVEAVEKVDQLKVYVDGTLKAASTYTVSGGTITFNTTPASGAVVTATYRYYWKVHLPADGISIEHVIEDFEQTGTLKFESWR